MTLESQNYDCWAFKRGGNGVSLIIQQKEI